MPSAGPREPQGDEEEARLDAAAAAGPSSQGAAAAPARVLTPSALKLDSRVLFAQATAVWLSNSVFCVFLLGKVRIIILPAQWCGTIGVEARRVAAAGGLAGRAAGPP